MNEMAVKALSTVFELWRQRFAEERANGTPENEIQSKLEAALKLLEQDSIAANVPAEMIERMKAMARECAMPPIAGNEMES